MSEALVAQRMPGPRWWLLLSLALGLGFAVNWGASLALLVVVFLFMVRPFDFLTVFLLLVCGASLVTIAGPAGGLTRSLSLLSLGVLVMLVVYVLTLGPEAFAIVRTRLTWPVLAYGVLSFVNACRGMLVGAEPRYVGLELIAVLSLGTSLLVANALDPERDLKMATVGVIVIAFAPAIRGFIVGTEKAHDMSTYMMAVPGIVGVMLVNLALRSKSMTSIIGLIALSLPLFLHQLITFGRGLWTGCLAGIALSVVLFAGVGRGTGMRWRRVLTVLGLLVLLGAVGGIQAALLLGHGDLLRDAGARFVSIGSTEEKYETRSTFARLWEYAVVARHIQQNPWAGYGLGYAFPVKQPWGLLRTQWVVHQNYLMVWLKQGVIGLLIFIWMIWAAITLGIREARRHREDIWAASWCATMAAGTLFLAVFSISNFPFTEVSGMFLLAILWGGTMALSGAPFLRFRWSRPDIQLRRPEA